MNFGQGSVSFVNNVKSSGGVTGANNGVMLDSGKVVLGNIADDSSAPAVLLNDREIPCGGFALKFTNFSRLVAFGDDAVIEGVNSVSLYSATLVDVRCGGDIGVTATGGSISISAGSDIFVEAQASFSLFATNEVNIKSFHGSPGSFGRIKIGVDSDSLSALVAKFDYTGIRFANELFSTEVDIPFIFSPSGNLTLLGTLKTGNTGGITTSVPFAVGDVAAAPVVLDTTRYIEVLIGGSLLKLGLVI
jgi:hypothetical protein